MYVVPEKEFDGAFERADLEENDWIYKTDLPLLLKDAFKGKITAAQTEDAMMLFEKVRTPAACGHARARSITLTYTLLLTRTRVRSFQRHRAERVDLVGGAPSRAAKDRPRPEA